MSPYIADLLKKIFVGLCIIITLILAVKVYEYISQKYFNIEGFEEIKSIVTREYTTKYLNNSPIWSNKFYNMQFDNDINKMQSPISFWQPDIDIINNEKKTQLKMTGYSISNNNEYKPPSIKTLIVDGDVKMPSDFNKIGEISGISGDIDWNNPDQFNILNDMQNSFNTIQDIHGFNNLYNNIYSNYVDIKNLYKTYNNVLISSMNDMVLKSLKFMGMQYYGYLNYIIQPPGTRNYFSMQDLKNDGIIESSESSNGEGYVTMFIPFGLNVELYSDANYEGAKYDIISPDNPTERNATIDDSNISSDYKQISDYLLEKGLDDNSRIKVCYPLPEKYDNFYSLNGGTAYNNVRVPTNKYLNETLNTHILSVKQNNYIHVVTFDIKLSKIFENAGVDYKLENITEMKTLINNINLLDDISNKVNLQRIIHLKNSLSKIKDFIINNATVRYQHFYLLPALFKEYKLITRSFIVKPSEKFYDNIISSITNELNNTNPLTYFMEKPKLFDIDYSSKGNIYKKLNDIYIITDTNYTNNNNFGAIEYNSNKSDITTREKEFDIFNIIIKSIENKTLGLAPLSVYSPIAPKNYKALGDIILGKLSTTSNNIDDLLKLKTDKKYACVPEHCVMHVRPWRTTDLFYEINTSTNNNQSNYLGFYMNPYTGTFKVSNAKGVLPTGSVEKVVACVKKCNVIDNLIRSNDCITKTAKNNKNLLNDTPVIDTSSSDAESQYYEDKIAQQTEVINELKKRAINIQINDDKYDIINKAENRAKLQNYVDKQKENIDIITQKLLGSTNRIDVNVRIPANLRIKVINNITNLINNSPNMSKEQKQYLINQALNITDSNELQSILNKCPTYDLDGFVKKTVVNDVCYGCNLE